MTTGTPVLPPSPPRSPYIGGWLESPGAGNVPSDGAPLHFWFIRKTADPNKDELALTASTYIFASEIVPFIPSGWAYFAPAQHAVVWHTGRGTHWQGLPDFFNPPRTPDLRLTGAGENTGYQLLNAGDSAGAWSTLSLAAFLADSCRDVILIGRAELAAGGTAGGAWIRPTSTSGNGERVAYCNSHATETVISTFTDMWAKTDGSRRIDWMTTGDVTLTLFIKGHRFSEPR